MRHHSQPTHGNLMLVAVAIAAALIFVSLAGPALSGRPFQIDEHVKSLVDGAQHPVVAAGMVAVSTLGDAAGLVPMILLLSGLAWRHSRCYAVSVPAIMVGAGLLQFVTKWAIDRPRPNFSPWGFPSGHVLSLVVLLGLTCYLIAVVAGARRRWSYLAAAASTVTLLVVAVSRLYLDAHWLSDVVGGFAIGLAYLLLVLRVFPSLAGVGSTRAGASATGNA